MAPNMSRLRASETVTPQTAPMLPPPTRPEAIVSDSRPTRRASDLSREARHPWRLSRGTLQIPVQGFAGREDDPEAGPDRAYDPDRERDTAALEGPDPDRLADHRELAEDGVDRFLAQLCVVGEDEAED
jgi:hypothetical protein